MSTVSVDQAFRRSRWSSHGCHWSRRAVDAGAGRSLGAWNVRMRAEPYVETRCLAEVFSGLR